MLSILSLAFFLQSLKVDDFPDVPPSHWAADAVRVLKDAGFVHGYPDGLFRG